MERFKKYISITICSSFIYLSIVYGGPILNVIACIFLFFIFVCAIIALLMPAKYVHEDDFESKYLTIYRAIMIPGSLLLSNMVPLAVFYFIILFLIDAKLNKLKSKEGK